MTSALFRAFAASAGLLASAGVANAADQLKVVASFSILGDFAREVGGDRVRITTLVGPNGDAHVYEPKPADAAAVAAADVVLVNGLHFEGFLERLIAASGTAAPVVEVSKGAELLPSTDAHEGGEHDGAGHSASQADAAGEAHSADHQQAGATGAEAKQGKAEHREAEHGEAHAHEATDPHAWQAVPNAIVYVSNIAESFCTADPSGCDGYRANAARYQAALEALHAEIRSAVATIPPEKRTIITSHDAFGYFEHEYGIDFIAPEGVSTESEASAAHVAALIRQIREDKASAIFVESITDPRLIEQIASETGLKIGGELYSDALSEQGAPAPTYIDMMRHNVETIRGAATGS